MKLLVTGAGGAIGGHLVNSLVEDGHRVRAVDIKDQSKWWQRNDEAENWYTADLTDSLACDELTQNIDGVYHLACVMGGISFIEQNKTLCNLTSLIDLHLLKACERNGVQRLFHSSSACIYPARKQNKTQMKSLKESDAYPADCEDGYGWAKLYAERCFTNAQDEGLLDVRIARYHNVYGPFGSWEGGREKAPAAITRKVISAKLSGKHEIEIWGDGEQERSFMYVDDCIQGTKMIMEGSHDKPLNLGSSELVSINELVDIAEGIAGVKLDRKYDLTAPQGVRGRNSDNTLIKKTYKWEPSIPLRDGMAHLYKWIYKEMTRNG